MDSKILVIAGMHRSGTSLISHWLYRCGLNIGDMLLGSAVGNVEGHFEDLDFLRFHEDTLVAGKLSEFGFIHHPVTELSLYQKEKLKGLIGFKSNMYDQWGWKEPRTCLFLDHYREIIPEAHYLIIIRDFRTTVSSLIQRDIKNIDARYLLRNWFSRQAWQKIRRKRRRKQLFTLFSEFYLNVWITYNEALLKHIRNLPGDKFAVIDHNLPGDMETALFDKLVSQWHFSLNYVSLKDLYKKSLISDVINIDPFIQDRELLEKAQNLQTELRKYTQFR
ncbi:MAG TPA: hypothetical protein VGC08_10280 [Pedobacter sp.]